MRVCSPGQALRRLFGVALLSLIGLQPALAEDMWEGVFTYQQKMADYGNPEAQVKLGEMYEEGHGTARDYEMARKWYQKAADQGYEPAKKKLVQLGARKQKEAEAKKRAEQERLAQEQAEKERLAREKAAAEEQARKAQAEKERIAHEAEMKQKEAAKKADKAQQAREEELARKRAQEAMKKMMSAPSGYSDE